MGAKINRRTVATVDLPNGKDVEVPSFCAEAIEVKVVRVGSGFVVGVLVPDNDSRHLDPRTNDDGFGDFKEFGSQGERDAFLNSVLEEGKLAFVVDKYEHGLVSYSVSGTVSYVDQQWDVAPSGVFVPCEDLQEEFAKRRDAIQATLATGEAPVVLRARAHEAAAQEFIKSANSSLEEFSDWANGNVYGVCVYHFDRDGERLGEGEAIWGLIGTEYAERELAEQIDFAVQPDADFHVGFVGCSADQASMLEGYGFRVAAYDAEREGVFVEISPAQKAAALAELASFPKDFRVELHQYLKTDAGIATWQGTGAAVDLERRKAAQLAWAEWNMAAKDIDSDSAAYWKELIGRINTRAVELAQGDRENTAAAPAADEGMAPGM
ncbi:hypothetical protein [Ralstonia sp. ASV6]|uniref:hypothetical protein n=1 Tax=Ralstonia sp. ASV6 TaxID=2795124 RepID=UPI0018EDA695|nr:hypothetical protein [Ralstonia sp. ASV6]